MTASSLKPRRANQSAITPLPRMPTRNATPMASRWLATPRRSRPATSRNHGPAHKVWMAMWVPAVVASSGAIARNALSR